MSSRKTFILEVGVGCMRGPMEKPGFIATKSMPHSSANFQATSSAKVFESWYQSWKNPKPLNKRCSLGP
jgi:hypothetical protein